MWEFSVLSTQFYHELQATLKNSVVFVLFFNKLQFSVLLRICTSVMLLDEETGEQYSKKVSYTFTTKK